MLSTLFRAKHLLPMLLVPIALLPNLSAALPLKTYFFRDISLFFLPWRGLLATELSAGRLPFWNPYVHEGEFMPPTFYPVDLLLALAPSPQFFSWLLTLHLPLAALAAYALGRSRGMTRIAAFATGGFYALGGVTLSSLNLYNFLQAVALAPLVLLTLDRAVARGGRWIAAAAAVVALSLSTMIVEILAQALVLGALLALWRDDADPAAPRVRIARLLGAVTLGFGLAGVPVAVTLGFLPETVRGSGLAATDMSGLALPPLALLQMAIPSLFGAHDSLLETWWGDRFFRDGFPFYLSLYLGAVVLALSAAGAAGGARRERAVLLAGAFLGAWYALGAAGGLWTAVQAVPGMGAVRFPAKAMFVVHLAAVLLAGRGIDRLREAAGWRVFALVTTAAGGAIVALAAAGWVAGPSLVAWLRLEGPAAHAFVQIFPRDAALTAAVGLVGAGIAAAVLGRLLRPQLAVALVVALAIGDLARAGAGINKQVTPDYFRLDPRIAAALPEGREAGRVFIYPTMFSVAFNRWVASRPAGVEQWLFYLNRQALYPYSNMLDRVESAASLDVTRLIPVMTELNLDAYHPGNIATTLPRLRDSAVSRLISFDPIEHPELALRAAVPSPFAGLVIYVYEVARPWPRDFVACRVWQGADRFEAADLTQAKGFDPWRDVAFEAERPAPPSAAGCHRAVVLEASRLPDRERFAVEVEGGDGWLVSRATHARGWRARVDGVDVELRRADGRHRAVKVGSGRHEVVMYYEPPGLLAGLAMMALSLLVLSGIMLRRVKARSSSAG